MSGVARYVGAQASTWTHAVWVPHDLEVEQSKFLTVEGHPPLMRFSAPWSGRAACGYYAQAVHAGYHGGHDWDRVPSDDQCPRCRRAIERAT